MNIELKSEVKLTEQQLTRAAQEFLERVFKLGSNGFINEEGVHETVVIDGHGKDLTIKKQKATKLQKAANLILQEIYKDNRTNNYKNGSE